MALIVVLGIFGAVAGGYCSWLCIQSLMQAKLLRTARSLRPLIDSTNAAIAICGPVQVQRSVTAHGLGGSHFWVEEHHQELRGMGKNRSWRTTHRQVHMADFTIKVGDEDVTLGDFPTELQGKSSRTDTHGGGFLSFEDPTRVTYTWLPVSSNLTVLGMLVGNPGNFRMAKARSVGLVLSPHPPEKSAAIERLKGVCGLFAIGVVVLVIIYLCIYGQ